MKEDSSLSPRDAPSDEHPPQAWMERAAEIIIDEIGQAPDGLAAAWDAALRIYRLAREPDTRGEEHLSPLRDRIAVLEEALRAMHVAFSAKKPLTRAEGDRLELMCAAALSNQGRL